MAEAQGRRPVRRAAGPLLGRLSAGEHLLGWSTPVCTTDFEGATIAPAEFDLGWFLSFDRLIHEACGNPRLDGEPTREELVGVYEQALGRRAVGVRWHEAFGAARYCTLVLRIMNRLEERGLLPPGSDLYLGGGVTDALRMQLEER